MAQRRKGRQAVLEVLYQREITGEPLASITERQIGAIEKQSLAEFCRQLLVGIETNQAVIDKLIDDYAKNWAIERLPLIDLNILRVAVYEMVYEESIPLSVSINEAIELAKIYGSGESAKFINGVLGQLALSLEQKGD